VAERQPRVRTAEWDLMLGAGRFANTGERKTTAPETATNRKRRPNLPDLEFAKGWWPDPAPPCLAGTDPGRHAKCALRVRYSTFRPLALEESR
jgi:hypothetical protein